jgi:exonuclease VII small subunit
VALESSLASLQHANLDKNKKQRFLKDVQEALQKVLGLKETKN